LKENVRGIDTWSCLLPLPQWFGNVQQILSLERKRCQTNRMYHQRNRRKSR
jgi:hypothetical protein